MLRTRAAHNRRYTAAALQKQCERWNKAYPVGTTVKYFPVTGAPKYAITKTRGEAFVLSGHTAVIFVEGVSGCVALENCERIEPGK